MRSNPASARAHGHAHAHAQTKSPKSQIKRSEHQNRVRPAHAKLTVDGDVASYSDWVLRGVDEFVALAEVVALRGLVDHK